MKPVEIITSIVIVLSIALVPVIKTSFDEWMHPCLSFLEPYWATLVAWSGPSTELNIYVTVGVAGTVFFWLLSAPYTICDLTGWPKWMLKYRTNENKKVPVDLWQWFKAFVGTVFNQLVLGPLILPIALKLSHSYSIFGPTDHTAPLPSASIIVAQVAFCFLCEDVILWACHYTFHRIPFLWNMHKWHHVWLHPTAIDGIFCHPVEQLFVNMPAFFGGLILGGIHPFSYAIFLFCGMHNVVMNHCGYHLPFTFSGEHHDFHHLTYNSNFGAYGLADWLAGTDAKFLKSVQHSRDNILWGLVPMTTLYPSDSFVDKTK